MRKVVRATGALRRATTYARRTSTLALLSFAIAGCATDPPPFNPHALQRPERTRATENVSRPLPPLPTTMESPLSATRPTSGPDAATTGPSVTEEDSVRLALQEIIQRTVANNSEVRVAGYEPAVDATRVVEAEARFDPEWFTQLNFEDQRILSPSSGLFSTASPFDPQIFRTWTFRNGIRQNLMSGGQVETSYGIQRINRDPASGRIRGSSTNPYELNELILKVTQPLLRDFGTDVNRARISIAANNQRISFLEFRKTLEENISEVDQNYWRIVQAEEVVRIQEDLLNRTLGTAKILVERMGAGIDASRLQTAQATASVEARRATLIAAKQRIRDLSDELKRRMNDSDLPVSSPLVVLPANGPVLERFRFDLGEQVATALESRFELGEQQIRINSADIAREVAKNNLLPQLNLTGQVNFQGVGNDSGGAFSDQKDLDNISWSAGLELSIPFGNRAARAIYKRALLQRMQAIEQYRALVNQVTVDVTQAAREVETTWNLIVARRRARFQQADALLAIQQRRQANAEALTPTFVQLELDTQERLANAQEDEATAISNYNISIGRLERAKGTLLRYYNILMEQQRSPRR